MPALESLGSSLRRTIARIRGASLVDERLVKETVRELEQSLLSADVKVDLVRTMTKRVEDSALNDEVSPGVSRRNYVIKVIYDEIAFLLGRRHSPLRLDSSKMNVLMFVGIQGSGKTTSLSKLARYQQKRGFKIGVIAGDTFRPGAYQQLVQLLEPHDIEVFGDESEKKSVKIISRGLKHFESSSKTNLVLIDTAGRHKDEKSLLKEMQSIAKKAKPDEIVLVVDGTIGQQAFAQAEEFNRTTEIGSIFLTKLDGTAKGGGAISAVAATGCKIRFYGDGEKIDDIEEFDPTKFVSNILGIPDLQGILESIASAGLLENQEIMADAFKRGKITLRHFKIQMESVQGGGSLKRLVSKISGIGGMNPYGNMDVQGKENIIRFTSILRSMTEEELDNPRLIKIDRVKRIARGSGTSLDDVRALLKQFDTTQQMLKKMRKARRGGMRGMPGGGEMFPP